jgi:hypothetical protein
MKNKNTSIINLGIVVLIFIAYTPTAFALKQAIFPDSKSLQPLPPDSYPNISGNVNSTTSVSPTYEYQTSETVGEESASIIETPTADKKTSPMVWPLILLGGIIAFFVYRRIKRSKKTI